MFGFQGLRAERIFRVKLGERISPIATICCAVLFAVVIQLYFNTRVATGGTDRPWVSIITGLVISYFLFQRAYHGKYASIQDVNDDIDGMVGVDGGRSKDATTWCCCRCETKHWCRCHPASNERFFIMFGNRLCFLYAVFDLLNCYVIISNFEGFGEEMWTPGSFLIGLSFVLVCGLSQLVFVKALPVLLLMLSTRIAIFAASPTTVALSSRGIQVLCFVFIMIILWRIERDVRINYKAGHTRSDLAKDRRYLELSTQVRKQEIGRQAIREAKHLISECFNTVLLAAQRLERTIVVAATQLEEGKGGGEGEGEGKKEAALDLIQVTCSQSELRLCSQMIESAKKEYISLQKNNPSSINQVVVNILNSEVNVCATRALSASAAADTTRSSRHAESVTLSQTVRDILDNRTKKRTVLVVDDNVFVRQFVAAQIRAILSEDGVPSKVDVVGENAQETLTYLLESTFEYDLVLIDMNMPGSPGKSDEAGLWCTQQYKKERKESSTKFICVSGLGRDEYLQEKCRAAGMAAPYAVGKPFAPGELAELLQNLKAAFDL